MIDMESDGEYEVEHENYLARVRVVYTGENHESAIAPAGKDWEEMIKENVTTGKRINIRTYPIYAVGVKWLPKFQAIRTETAGEVPVIRPLTEQYLLLGITHDDSELTTLVKKGEYLAHEIKDPKDYKG